MEQVTVEPRVAVKGCLLGQKRPDRASSIKKQVKEHREKGRDFAGIRMRLRVSTVHCDLRKSSTVCQYLHIITPVLHLLILLRESSASKLGQAEASCLLIRRENIDDNDTL